MDWIKIPFSSETGKGDAEMLLILGKKYWPVLAERTFNSAKNYNGGQISKELGGCIKRLAVDSGVQDRIHPHSSNLVLQHCCSIIRVLRISVSECLKNSPKMRWGPLTEAKKDHYQFICVLILIQEGMSQSSKYQLIDSALWMWNANPLYICWNRFFG